MDPRPPLEPGGSVGPAALDEVDADLTRLAHLPVADHIDVFAEIHQRLATTLAATSQDPVQPPDPADPIRPGRQRSR